MAGVIISKIASASLAPVAASIISKHRAVATLPLLQDLKAAVNRIAASDAALAIKFALDCASNADAAPADFLPPGLIARLSSAADATVARRIAHRGSGSPPR